MHNHTLRSFDGIKGSTDQVLSSLNQQLNGHIIRDQVILYQVTTKVELSISGRRKTNFDLLKTNAAEELKELELFLD